MTMTGEGSDLDRTAGSFQARVAGWMSRCFDQEVIENPVERGDRLLEEVFELLQACGYSRERVEKLCDYTWSRPAGDPAQEMGGVMVTLAAFSQVHDLDMLEAGEAELARVSQPGVIAKIRKKQAAKPTGDALMDSRHGTGEPETWMDVLAGDLWEYAAQHVDAGIFMGSDGKGNANTKPMTGAYLRAIGPAAIARSKAVAARTHPEPGRDLPASLVAALGQTSRGRAGPGMRAGSGDEVAADTSLMMRKVREMLAALHPFARALWAARDQLPETSDSDDVLAIALRRITLNHLQSAARLTGYSAGGAVQDVEEHSFAAQAVLAERQRQKDEEGWSETHDDEHRQKELVRAAVSYIQLHLNGKPSLAWIDWPWDPAWFKPASGRRNLVKAAALLLAEIERLDRSGQKEETT